MSSLVKFVLSVSCYYTGGLAAAFPSFLSEPYGQTYFHRPAGRFSDGRLIIDFIAKSLGLPYLRAYLDSQGTNFKHGANFATAASTIRLPNRIIPNGGPVHDKYNYFKQALYTFDIGQNDLGEGIFGNLTIQQVNASVPDIVSSFSTNFKNIYNTSGGTSFWIHNTGPMGCLPYILANFPSAERDKAGCSKPHNDLAQYFNYQLKQAVLQLRKELPLARWFEQPLVACCGYGGRYNYGSTGCGGTAQLSNGSRIFVGSCERPWARINWDGIHYTEAANKLLVAFIVEYCKHNSSGKWYGEYNHCEFPADSNSDTGGLTAAFPKAVSKPYGDTYFHEPVVRNSDGRFIIDVIDGSDSSSGHEASKRRKYDIKIRGLQPLSSDESGTPIIA
ncbi:hypothetical protein FNV43_RR12801 [Rhamnella rubrinervis]|uniref:Uncharacterized protein n=1 Tax=Rhamnella rubrinervis TaxID=2594499 RepID=A0A8K0H8Y3_9ROSA|nr:hypothetical protein FNV43_RR12801 [Rhamnella rubrinervis]